MELILYLVSFLFGWFVAGFLLGRKEKYNKYHGIVTLLLGIFWLIISIVMIF